MIICGVEIKGSEAIFALATRQGGDIGHLPLVTKKLALEDDDEAANVKVFASQLAGFVRENGVSHVVIKKRSKKGEFAGGPTTFKIETIFQLMSDCEVLLISPQTINAQNKKHNFALPDTLNKYQHEAYKAACAGLMKSV
ncbi:hypothetical protein ALP36_01398 [Pseudomonas syringae pv. coriandricola]|uniref:DUF3010 domain-containing protein n=1 Tax=Pseudomonas syringae pv. coriandricola TaxID=264453 RepID=A0A3M4TNC0_9PSED|nr:DUF3010 family protein [Pseudomonas syringae group genomosp. 3]RMR28735.1 hypothetical protein ALP87_03278 [Pseudomonas syringae pv. coriandricola]RMU07132.1 hypothetical protein ALP36_01398 [Pseudomonas syringae pv. coriandricola]